MSKINEAREKVGVSGSRFSSPQRSTHLVQMLEDFSIGLKEACLVVRDIMLLAKGFDDVLCCSQLVPGNSREQMVLDLVIQPAIPEIGERMRSDIARTEYLLMQKVQRAVFI